jgi:hypothetical protein
MKKKIIIGSVFAIIIMLSVPLISTVQAQNIQQPSEKHVSTLSGDFDASTPWMWGRIMLTSWSYGSCQQLGNTKWYEYTNLIFVGTVNDDNKQGLDVYKFLLFGKKTFNNGVSITMNVEKAKSYGELFISLDEYGNECLYPSNYNYHWFTALLVQQDNRGGSFQDVTITVD